MSKESPEFIFEEHVVAPDYEAGPNAKTPEVEETKPLLEDELPTPPPETA